MPNGVSPNQLPHPPTRARAATAARRTTGQSEAAQTGSNEQTKKRRKRERRRRRGREVNGRRGQIEAGSQMRSALKSPVRKSEPGDGLVRNETYKLRIGGGAIDW